MNCPVCDQRLHLSDALGTLGNLRWYRCPACGMNCSKRLPKRKLHRKVEGYAAQAPK